MAGMEMVIHVTPEMVRSVKPWSRAKEDAAVKPLGAIVSRGSTIIRPNVVITVRTIRLRSNAHPHTHVPKLATGKEDYQQNEQP
jgi:hypothetical protein